MFVVFFALWLLMAGEVTVRVCLWGGAASALVCWFAAKALGCRLWPRRGSWRKLGAGAAYLAGLAVEMMKAGFAVMGLIYGGKRLEPKLIWFDTPVRSSWGQAVLADSITLTAGTITVLAEDGRFLVHALDASLARGIEDSAFQRQLEKLEV